MDKVCSRSVEKSSNRRRCTMHALSGIGSHHGVDAARSATRECFSNSGQPFGDAEWIANVPHQCRQTYIDVEIMVMTVMDSSE